MRHPIRPEGARFHIKEVATGNIVLDTLGTPIEFTGESDDESNTLHMQAKVTMEGGKLIFAPDSGTTERLYIPVDGKEYKILMVREVDAAIDTYILTQTHDQNRP